MHHHRSLFAVAILAATTIAQTTVLPTSAATVGGSTGNVFPWGTTSTLYTGMRIMCIYDSTHFTAATPPITTPILISTLKWRANDVAATTSWTGGTYPNATVRMATAAVDYTAASTNWNSNVSPDVTTVYTGPVTVSPGMGAGVGVPGPFHVTITLPTPFFYDPNLGDLVVDTEHIPSSYAGSAPPALDVHIPGVKARRVFSSTLYPNANGVDFSCDVMEIGYSMPAGTPAANLVLGDGCVRSNTSFFEFFASPADFDLAGTGIMMIPGAGGGYVVTQGGTFMPVGSVQPMPTALALGDDAGVVQALTVGTFVGPSGPWTSIHVISNGIISEASGNTLTAAPNPHTMLQAPQTGFWSQGDWEPMGSPTGLGTIWFEESSSVITITWDNVKSWSTTGTNTFQFQLYPSGQVHVVWVSMTPLGANGGVMVGYSPAGPSLNPGNRDLTTLATTSITLGPTDIEPLRLGAATRPVVGTNWNLTVSQIPATGVFGLDIFGIADPAIMDLAFLGMPGCQLRTTPDVLVGPWFVAGVTHNYSLAVPAQPSLIGFQLFTQSAVFQSPPVNAFGAIMSNGERGTLGGV